MAANPKDTTARKLIGKLARTLLATTCLTVAGGAVAMAGSITYSEGTSLTNLATPTQLAAAMLPGLTTVTGTTIGVDDNEFELTGLGTGTFAISVQETDGDNNGALLFAGPNNSPVIFDFGTGLLVNGQSFGDTPAALGPFTIPASGDLYVGISPDGGESISWSVSVTTSSSSTVPEPSTVPTVGLGLAVALTLARKRLKQ